MIKRAILSVSDKTGIVELARRLAAQGVTLLSTGGTMKAIEEAGIPVTGVSDVTGFPECLPQPFLYLGQGYLRTVIFLLGFAVEFFGKVFLDFDDVMYLVRYDFHLGSTGHFNVTPFVRGGLRRAPCPSGKEQHE